jgi:hypothetical protein
MHEDGLDLVIGVMAHGHGISSHSFCNLGEEVVTNFAGCFLEGAAPLGSIGFYITPLYSGRNAELPGQLGNILSIGIRFRSPEQVIEMGHMELEAKPILYLDENMKQTD